MDLFLNTTIMPKKRLIYLDFVGGVLLIHMIIGHICQWTGYWHIYFKYTYWLNFFMAWFFYKAGIFHKDKEISVVVKNNAERLLFPYLVFSIVGLAIYYLKLFSYGQLTINKIGQSIFSFMMLGSPNGNLALWFLLSLFVVKCIYQFISKIKYCWILIIVISLLPILKNYIFPDQNIPLYFINIPLGLFFYYAGNKISKYKITKKLSYKLIVIYVLSMIFYPSCITFFSGKILCGDYLCFFFETLIGIVILNNLAEIYFNKSRVLSYIGKNTMPYYVMHWPLLV